MVRTCACGCGAAVAGRSHGRPIRFVSGHNLRVMSSRAPSHRAAIAEGQRHAWLTRRRLPLGTIRVAASGYVMVKVVEGRGQWRAAHVLTIEAELGRRLAPNEHVHHINGIKSDNRRDNLHLFSSSSDHTTAHRSIDGLLDQLLRSGAIAFDRVDGRYYDRVTTAPAPRSGRDSVDPGPGARSRRHARIQRPEPHPVAIAVL